MGYVLIPCGCIDTECIDSGIYMVVAFIFMACCLYLKWKGSLGGVKAMGTHAGKCGPGWLLVDLGHGQKSLCWGGA